MLTANATTVHIEAGALNDALKRVRPAISKEETRYYLCGIYMHYSEGALHFVATDGHRLSLVSVKMDAELKGLPGVILPPAFVADVIKATNKMARAHYDCPLVVTTNLVTAYPYEQPEITCTPIDGTFPDYLRVMPSGEPECGTYTFNRNELFNAVAALTAFREAAEDRPPALKLSFAGEELIISTHIETMYGETDSWIKNGASVTLKLSNSIQVPREIGFNGRYLVDMLKTIDERQHVNFRFFDPGSPAAFVAEQSGQWVIMPTRL